MTLRTPKAVLYMSISKYILATIFFVSLDSLAKVMMGSIPPVMVLWARYAFSCLLLVSILPIFGLKLSLSSRHITLQLCRSSLLLGVTACMFIALQTLPLAFSYSLFYASPLVVLLVVSTFTAEKLNTRQVCGACLGFVGVLVIIRPGWGNLQWQMLLPLLAAVLYALYQILTHYVARSDSTLSSLLYITAGGTFVTTLVLPWYFVSVSLINWVLLMLLGVLGTLGHGLLINAYKTASASVLSPFVYAQIVWATLIDIFIFNTSFQPLDVIGAAIVILAGLYILTGFAKRGQTDIDSI